MPSAPWFYFTEFDEPDTWQAKPEISEKSLAALNNMLKLRERTLMEAMICNKPTPPRLVLYEQLQQAMALGEKIRFPTAEELQRDIEAIRSVPLPPKRRSPVAALMLSRRARMRRSMPSADDIAVQRAIGVQRPDDKRYGVAQYQGGGL